MPSQSWLIFWVLSDTFSLHTSTLIVLFGGPAPDAASSGATECGDDLSLDEEDEEADKVGASKEQAAAGEIAPAAAAEAPLPADAGAVPEVRFSADIMSDEHVLGMGSWGGMWEAASRRLVHRGFPGGSAGRLVQGMPAGVVRSSCKQPWPGFCWPFLEQSCM